MSDLLPFVILGITSGSVYGLAGVGLVVSYKTSGVFNFAFGALATVAAYLFYMLNVQIGMPWPVAAVIAVVVLGFVLGILSEILAKNLASKALAIRIVSTLGIVLIVQGTFLLMYGTDARTFPVFLPKESVEIAGAFVSIGQMIVIVVSLALTGGLYLFFRLSRMGIAMRAVVDDPGLLDLAGTSPRAVRRTAWIISCMFALLAGILLAQSVNLDPIVLTSLVTQAFAAAALGAFSSLPITYLGGLVLGVAAAIMTKFVAADPYLAGLPASLPFIVLFVVLVVMPKKRLATRLQSIPLTASSWSAPLRVHTFWGVILVAVLCFVPLFASQQLTSWSMFLAVVIMFLSLGLLVRISGQISLAHAAFGAIGAVAFSRFAADLGIPWLFALILAGLVCVPVGAVIAIPAIRLSGLYLALATLGFGLLVQNVFYNTDLMFGTTGTGIEMPRPDLPGLDLQSDEGFYYVVLVGAIVVSVLAVTLARTRLGRLLRAVGDSPTALSTGGTSVHITQVLVFCISAFLAAIAGAFMGMSLTQVDPSTFDPTTSLMYLALIILSLGGAPWYAVMQGVGMTLIPVFITGDDVPYILQIVFGVFAVLIAFTHSEERKVPRWVLATSGAIARTLGYRESATRLTIDESQSDRAPARSMTGEGLEVADLRVQFGGLVAVSGLNLRAPMGTITGLIGPNGAGKTTSFDAVCGLNSPASGRITLNGRDITRLSPSGRAGAGLGRTYQQLRLYDSMTVYENVCLGREAAMAGANPLGQIFSGRTQRRQIAAAAVEALRLCGIVELAGRSVASLSTGQRRLVELARCLAGPFALLLLDEPSSGLDKTETERFAELLLTVVRERGVGILLVEHDMSLVMKVCERIAVLDFGVPVFEGTPAQVSRSAVVRAAYLGAEDTEIQPLEPGEPLAAEVRS